MTTVKLPRVFFDDRMERDLPTPRVLRQTKRHYVVNRNDPALVDYLDDALYYAGDVDACYQGLIASARATVKAFQ